MRVALGLFVGSCAMFGFAVGQGGGQAEPLAEQQFKNIVSFKGQKASDVLPAMEFMSASLHVSCDYCHVADRASDEKEEKKTAREMIAMQRDINTKNFNGRTVVTCATCHGGKTHPMPIPPVSGIDVRARRAPDLKPEDILAQLSKGLSGGPATGVRLSGTATEQGETSKVDAVYQGRKFLIVRHTAKGDVKYGYNGTQMWYAAPGFSTVIPPEATEHFRNEQVLYMTSDLLPKLRNQNAGTSKVGSIDTVVLSGLLRETGNDRASIFVDKSTNRPIRATYFYPTSLGTMAEVAEYNDIRAVGSLQIPMNVVIHTADGEIVRKYDMATPDAKIESSEFELPKSK